MSMSRKNYIEIAADIKAAVLSTAPNSNERKVIYNLAQRLCNTLQHDNSAFRRVTFLEACGLKDEK